MNRPSAEELAERSPAPTWNLRARLPLVLRKRAERHEARRRAAALTQRPLSDEQRAHDPLAHPRRGSAARAGLLAALLLGAAAIHVGVVAVGFLIGGREPAQRERIEQTVKVEVREPPPPPPPPPPEEKRPEPPKPPPPVVKKVAPPPPQPKTPQPAPKGPPPRVVGISLDSTSDQGGGPAFAVGETRAGQTAERAPEPKPVEAPPPPTPVAAPTKNAVASRIPVAGVQYTPPKRKRPHEPVYPETLKAQEIEADVTVMVSIDAGGRVEKVKIIRQAPYPEFNTVAEKTAHEEEFEPALRDGVPIPYTLSYTYRFRLETK